MVDEERTLLSGDPFRALRKRDGRSGRSVQRCTIFNLGSLGKLRATNHST